MSDFYLQGILYMLYCCVNMLFWRVFMRISYTCPEHIKFALTVQKWTELVRLTGDAIDWLDVHERAYDVWMLVSYCSTLCAFVQVRFRFHIRAEYVPLNIPFSI